MNLLIIGCITFMCVFIYTYYESIKKQLDSIQETIVSLVEESQRERSSRTIDYYV